MEFILCTGHHTNICEGYGEKEEKKEKKGYGCKVFGMIKDILMNVINI